MQEIIEQFISSVKKHFPDINVSTEDISYEFMPPPHDKPRLPKGKCAVYVFAITEGYIREELIGTVLKVGKVGPKSAPRFQNQHYLDNSTGSTVSKSINANPIIWDHLGIAYKVHNGITKCTHPGEWLKKSTDRHHFYIDTSIEHYDEVMSLLENYIRGIFGSLLEGTSSSRTTIA